MAITLAELARLGGRSPEEEIIEQAEDIAKPHVLNVEVGHAVGADVFVRGYLAHAIAAAQRFDDHLLLDCGDVLLQVQRLRHIFADGAESVLAVSQPHILRIVHAQRDDLAAEQPHELLNGGVQFIAAAQHARPRNVVYLPSHDGSHQSRNIVRVVRTVRIDKDQNIAPRLLDGQPDGSAFALATVGDDSSAACSRDLGRTVRALPIHNQQLIGVGMRPLQHRQDIVSLIARRHDDRDGESR